MGKWGKSAIVALIVLIGVAALWYGVQLRHDLYVDSQPTHFTLDVHNAYSWGRNARMVGVFNLYDRYQAGQRFSAQVELDYTPLRLLAASIWQGWTERHFPDVKVLTFDYDFVAPLLWGNTIAAALSSILVFLLIRMWVIRMDDARRSELQEGEPQRREGHEESAKESLNENSFVPLRASSSLRVSPAAKPFRGVAQGMIGALLLWFNPALLKNGYLWPQWDAWLLPFALAAIYLACLDWWFCAGLCLAIGASLKGQLLIAAPIMFIWPLFSFRFGALLRIAAGFMLANMAIALPWMKPTVPAVIWYCLMLAAMGLVIPIVLRWRLNRFVLIGLGAVAVLLAWPWSSHAALETRLLAVALIGLVVLMRWIPANLIPHGCALLVSIVIYLIIPLYDGHTAWYTQGFVYGPNREQVMHGPTANNLPNILQTCMHWPNDAHFKVSVLDHQIEMQSLMAMIYAAGLVLCGIAATMQYKRNDTRFLVAMFLPWLLFFLLLTQIRGRYLVWAAALSALLVGESVGLALLGLVITTVSLLEMMENQAQLDLQHLRIPLPDWLPDISVLEPHLGWLLLLIAAICLYVALSPRKRERVF